LNIALVQAFVLISHPNNDYVSKSMNLGIILTGFTLKFNDIHEEKRKGGCAGLTLFLAAVGE
jgi:hypothetical protein